MTAPPTDLAAALADRYRLERELGAGGMATVYLAQDVRHGRPVAIKVFRPEVRESLGADCLLREIQIAAQLRQPHILALHDSGEAAGYLYYLMPFVDGETLREIGIAARLQHPHIVPVFDRLTVGERLELIEQVWDSLRHGAGVLHLSEAEQVAGLGRAFIAELDATLAFLQLHPQMYASVSNDGRVRRALRSSIITGHGGQHGSHT